MKLYLTLALLTVSAAFAQRPTHGIDMQGSFLAPRSTTLPATCTLGSLYFDTDATAGANVYGCTATNTWTVQSGSVTCSILDGLIDTGLSGYLSASCVSNILTIDWSVTPLEAAAVTPSGYWNFSGGSMRLPESAYGSLPSAAANTGKVYMVTDGASSSCAAGSGSTRCLVASTGSAWQSLGSSGGGATSFVETHNFPVGGYVNGATQYTGAGWYIPVAPNAVTESIFGDYVTAGKHVFPAFVYADDGTNDLWATMQDIVSPGMTRLDVDVWTYEPDSGTGNISLKVDAACVASAVNVSAITPSWIGTPITVTLAASNTVGTETKNAFANVDITGCADGNFLLVRVRRAAGDPYVSRLAVIHARTKQTRTL